LSLQEVVTVQDRNNVLLNRRELIVIIKNAQGKLNKATATSLVAGHFRLNAEQSIIPLLMKYETGRTDIHASFYVYPTLEHARRQLPKHMMLRNMPKEDRKKIIDEEKAMKLKAKQTAAAEAKGGRSKK
jgi:small subunit ribosomal protein S24e